MSNTRSTARSDGTSASGTAAQPFRSIQKGIDAAANPGDTIGIVGLGEIGREIALRAAAFGMNIVYFMIPLGLVLVGCAAWAFFWAVGNGQFDDLDTPAIRILFDDEEPRRLHETSATETTPDPRSAAALAKAETRRVLR